MLNDLSTASKGLAADRSARQNYSRVLLQSKDMSDVLYKDPTREIYRLRTSMAVEARARGGVPEDILAQRTAEDYKPQGILNAFKKTCQRWCLDNDGQGVLLGDPYGVFLGKQSLAGHVRFVSRDMKDRVGYIVAISLGLGILFDENSELEKKWLKHPRQNLQGKSPLDCMLEGSMKNLITVNDIVERERGL